MLETHFDKSATLKGSSNAGVWGRNSQLPEANGNSAAILEPFF